MNSIAGRRRIKEVKGRECRMGNKEVKIVCYADDAVIIRCRIEKGPYQRFKKI